MLLPSDRDGGRVVVRGAKPISQTSPTVVTWSRGHVVTILYRAGLNMSLELGLNDRPPEFLFALDEASKVGAESWSERR